MRKLLTCSAGCASAQCLPSPTLEFAGRVNSDIGTSPCPASVSAHSGRKALHLVGERIEMDRAVGEGDVPIFVLPRDGVLQPVLVIALAKVLARMRAARFGALDGGVSDDYGLICEIGKLQRRDQRDVPLQ